MDENYEIAYKYFVNRDYENSKQQLERNINLYPNDVKTILLYAAIFLVEGNFVQGLDILEKLIMNRILEQIPIQLTFFIPFPEMSNLISHKI